MSNQIYHDNELDTFINEVLDKASEKAEIKINEFSNSQKQLIADFILAIACDANLTIETKCSHGKAKYMDIVGVDGDKNKLEYYRKKFFTSPGIRKNTSCFDDGMKILGVSFHRRIDY